MTLTRRTPLKGGRVPLRRGAPLKRDSGLRQGTGGARSGAVSTVPRWVREGRRQDLEVPRETRALIRDRSRGRCEAAIYAAGCTQTATDVHHRKRRRDGGHGVPNLLDLCRECHRWAHANPAEARRLGLIVSVYEDPAAVPVHIVTGLTGQREPVELTLEGTYELTLEGLEARRSSWARTEDRRAFGL